MQHIHARHSLKEGQIVKLVCDTQCNFMLMDDTNYSNYKNGRGYKYFGGFYTHFPARIAVSRTGSWNVVIDLGGGSANIKYDLTIIG